MREVILRGGPADGRVEVLEQRLWPPPPREAVEERRARMAAELSGYSEATYEPTGEFEDGREVYRFAEAWP